MKACSSPCTHSHAPCDRREHEDDDESDADVDMDEDLDQVEDSDEDMDVEEAPKKRRGPAKLAVSIYISRRGPHST